MAKFMRGVPLKLQYQCKSCKTFTFKVLLSPASVCPNCIETQRKLDAARSQSEALAVPCQISNKCIGTVANAESDKKIKEKEKFELSAQHKKSTTALEINVEGFFAAHDFDAVGFLTLTFADDVTCAKEAQRRFKSFRTNFLNKHFGDYIRCTERQKNGRIHFHLIIDCGVDIRRGFDFGAVGKRRNYKSANTNLKRLWAKLRKAMPIYGFGRHELLPIRTNAQKVAKYVGKYIAKHIQARLPEDKGIRLVQTSIDKANKWKVANCNFAFISFGAMTWRQKLKMYVESNQTYWSSLLACLGYPAHLLNHENYSDLLQIMLGKSWGYRCREIILEQVI